MRPAMIRSGPIRVKVFPMQKVIPPELKIDVTAKPWSAAVCASTPIGDVPTSTARPTTPATITASIDLRPSSVQ